MARNEIRRIRKLLGLTQAALAEMAGISKQHLQVYESGVTPVKLARANAIAACLDAPLAELFPDLRFVELDKYDRASMFHREAAHRYASMFNDAGIDPEPLYWKTEIRFADFAKTCYLPGYQMQTLRARFENTDRKGFLVVDTDNERLAVNMGAVETIAYVGYEDDDEDDGIELGRGRIVVNASGKRHDYLEMPRDTETIHDGNGLRPSVRIQRFLRDLEFREAGVAIRT